ncbi:MAG TPA: acyl carrier protein [Blastocatellia bacterium]|nr:acyl carrier protein [Blastocatellia bacterium]
MQTTSYQADPVLSGVIEIIQKTLKDRDEEVELEPHMSLTADLDLDSLTVVEIFLDLEDRFVIKLNDVDIQSAVTIADIKRIVSSKQSGN